MHYQFDIELILRKLEEQVDRLLRVILAAHKDCRLRPSEGLDALHEARHQFLLEMGSEIVSSTGGLP